MPYTFTGDGQRTYPQYLDLAGGTLVADPGGSYDMMPASGLDHLPVPPADGLWEAPHEDPPPPPADDPPPPASDPAPPVSDPPADEAPETTSQDQAK